MSNLYINLNKNTCVTLPHRVSNCLQVDNFLSEYGTDEEKELVMLNILLLDETPTEDSTRLVNSGDLYRKFKECELKLETKINLLLNLLDNLSTKVSNMITNEFRNDENTVPSNKLVSGVLNSILDKIEDITGESTRGISMSVNPTYFASKNGCNLHIKATTLNCTGIFEDIKFFINGTLIWPLTEEEGKNVEYVEFDTHIDDASIIKCEALILGVKYEKQREIKKYFGFWIGAGTTPESIMTSENIIEPTVHLRSSRNISIEDNQNIIIVIENDLKDEFIRADINGIEIPFTEGEITIGEDRYKTYISTNTYTRGEYNIDING